MSDKSRTIGIVDDDPAVRIIGLLRGVANCKRPAGGVSGKLK